MRKIVSCEFNMDTACVELCLEDGTLLHFSEDPEYRAEYPDMPVLPEKVYIIRDDTVETMLFASEY